MFNYSKRNVIIISIIISVVIYISLNLILINFNKKQKSSNNENLILKTSNNNPITNSNKNNNLIENLNRTISTNQYKSNNWRISIPKINLDAPILEGTTKEILRRGVGHFKTTSKTKGNVCLAAHNRGYKYNYFSEIKKLEKGDVIKYQLEDNKKSYVVVLKEIIKETDMSYIKDTKENKLTLITCVENCPEYRICIQAIEIKS